MLTLANYENNDNYIVFRIGTFHFLLLAICSFLLKTNVGTSERGGGVYQSKAHIDSVLSQQLQKADPSLFSGSEPLKLFWYVQGPHLSEGGGGVKYLILTLIHMFQKRSFSIRMNFEVLLLEDLLFFYTE